MTDSFKWTREKRLIYDPIKKIAALWIKGIGHVANISDQPVLPDGGRAWRNALRAGEVVPARWDVPRASVLAMTAVKNDTRNSPGLLIPAFSG